MRVSLLTLAGVLPLVASQDTLYPNATYSDALSLIKNQTSLTAMWAALEQYIEIASPFAHYTNVTIFAPDNDAILSFTKSSSLFAQANNRTTTEALLTYHLLPGQYVNTSKLTFGPTFLSPSTFTTVTGGQHVGISGQNGNITVLSGESQQAVSVSDTLYFQGGVVHIIDKVLTIPMDISSTTTSLNLTATSGAFNLTGITTSLASTWDVTIFAPANSGFAAIASEAANMTVAEVTKLMKYHMIVGNVVYSTQFSDTSYTTLQGNSLNMVTNQDGSVYVNNARVIQSDVLLANGVMHIIDNVLNPDNTTVVPTPTASGVVAFAGARANGTTPFTNVPIPGTGSNGPSSTSAAAPKSSKTGLALSTGVIAGIAVGSTVVLILLIAGICFCLRLKGYHVRVSRKSMVISSPRLIEDHEYELPPSGGKTEKVELPASVPYEHIGRARSNHASSEVSTVQSYTAALLEKPPVPAKDYVKPKKRLPSFPLSPRQNVFELSADQDVRARIEKLLNPRGR